MKLSALGLFLKNKKKAAERTGRSTAFGCFISFLMF
jgi:hypothetical protein